MPFAFELAGCIHTVMPQRARVMTTVCLKCMRRRSVPLVLALLVLGSVAGTGASGSAPNGGTFRIAFCSSAGPCFSHLDPALTGDIAASVVVQPVICASLVRYP